MEKKIKTQRTDDVKESIPPKKPLSPFNFPDLTIKIGDEKLYVNRDDLMEASPYFLKMLTGSFKEKDDREIELPEDPTTFALFLRHILPGFDDIKLSEKEADLILPLADKYLMDNLLSKIDHTLAKAMTENKCEDFYSLNAKNELIDNILKAELYNLQHLLTACL